MDANAVRYKTGCQNQICLAIPQLPFKVFMLEIVCFDIICDYFSHF